YRTSDSTPLMQQLQALAKTWNHCTFKDVLHSSEKIRHLGIIKAHFSPILQLREFSDAFLGLPG
ncbi:hypothetical protein XENOCAPTIV_011782, partial [Xenoophorus captivus]